VRLALRLEAWASTVELAITWRKTVENREEKVSGNLTERIMSRGRPQTENPRAT
jgi:hypothetical protein